MASKVRDSVIQVKVSQELKREAEELFEEIGLDMPSAIRLFIKQSVIAGNLPFPVKRAKKRKNNKKDRAIQMQPMPEPADREISEQALTSDPEDLETGYSTRQNSSDGAMINDLY